MGPAPIPHSMQPLPEFVGEDRAFWANVRFISERSGYSNRRTKLLKSYAADNIVNCYRESKLNPDYVFDRTRRELNDYGRKLMTYLNKRNRSIETYGRPP